MTDTSSYPTTAAPLAARRARPAAGVHEFAAYDECAAILVEWFQATMRPLEWRKPGTSPWGVLLSEVMSQQTPVARVEPLWLEWMERFPTPQHLADARSDEVLRMWANLGYPRRALRLKECATVLARDFAGQVPDDVDTLKKLPGVGDYTARAVAAFAYKQPVSVVDTNVRRVVSRLVFGRYLAGQARAKDNADTQPFIDGIDSSTGHVVAAALMELGAVICTANSPDCESCPVFDYCQWNRLGRPEPTDEEQQSAAKRRQKFAGTDRQVRGKIMAVLRDAEAPVERPKFDVIWPDQAQLDRCMVSLLEDGLAAMDQRGRIHLPHE